MENVNYARVEALRALMQENGWDIVILTGSDPHASEYPAARWKQVEWLSGFTGEAGDIVVTRDPKYYVPDAIIVHSVKEAAKAAADYPADDVFVIGGASIYRQFLPLCDTAYVTKIDYAYDADTYFPNLDEAPDWELLEESDEQTYYDLTYAFTTYNRIAEDPVEE